MPTPLPDPTQFLLEPPDATEVAGLSRAICSAVAGDGELTETQRLLLEAVLPAMTGHPAVLDGEPLGPEGFGAVLALRSLGFRTRIVQTMVLLALLARPIPPELADRVAAYAREACVEEGMLDVARRLADGSLGLAAVDFERLEATLLEAYGRRCAWTLARAHARSGTSAQIAGYLGGSTRFEEAMSEFALAYRDRNARDYQALHDAAAQGRISTED